LSLSIGGGGGDWLRMLFEAVWNVRSGMSQAHTHSHKCVSPVFKLFKSIIEQIFWNLNYCYAVVINRIPVTH
jgi:hypothetical protein